MAAAEDLLFHDVTFTIFTGPTISSDEEQRVSKPRPGHIPTLQNADRRLTVNPSLDQRRSHLHPPERRWLN
jgi:hypothetical protein